MAKEEIRDAVYTRRYIYNFHYHLIWGERKIFCVNSET